MATTMTIAKGLIGRTEHPAEEWIRLRTDAPVPEGTPLETWKSWGVTLAASEEVIAWKIARWLIYGDRHFKLNGPQLAEILDMGVSHVRKLRWVGGVAIDLRERFPQFKKLPFMAFQVVASRHLPETMRIQILQDAVDGKWRVNRIQEAAKAWLEANGCPTYKKIDGGRQVNKETGKVDIPLSLDHWRKLVIIAKQNEYPTGTQYLKALIENAWAEMFPVPRPEEEQIEA
jgi:hypothetical protein